MEIGGVRRVGRGELIDYTEILMDDGNTRWEVRRLTWEGGKPERVCIRTAASAEEARQIAEKERTKERNQTHAPDLWGRANVRRR